jgi:hypothetical protein
MKRIITRIIGNEWCDLELSLENGRLSICGSTGTIIKRREAEKMAVEYWESFFEENPAEMVSMNKRFGKRFTSERSAAKFVLATDGEFHGLDVHRDCEDGTVQLTQGCGQIIEDLKRFFPEVEPYLKWHLNDMKAERVHQEARGETRKTHSSAECPDCGYKLGSQWLKRELPAEVIAWVETFEKKEVA